MMLLLVPVACVWYCPYRTGCWCVCLPAVRAADHPLSCPALPALVCVTVCSMMAGIEEVATQEHVALGDAILTHLQVSTAPHLSAA